MYEKWELRQADIDIEFCKQKGIKVAGTWENYPALKIFDYCEQLIVKMVFEAGYEIAQNNILVWSNDHFGKLAQKGFLANGASSVKKVFAASDVYSNAAKVDFVFFL
jgi:maltose-binding protein MalE